MKGFHDFNGVKSLKFLINLTIPSSALSMTKKRQSSAANKPEDRLTTPPQEDEQAMGSTLSPDPSDAI